MLGRRSRRVGTVPAEGGELSFVIPFRWKVSRDDEGDEEDGDPGRPKALVVVAKRIGEVGLRRAKEVGRLMDGEGDISRSVSSLAGPGVVGMEPMTGSC